MLPVVELVNSGIAEVVVSPCWETRGVTDDPLRTVGVEVGTGGGGVVSALCFRND